MSIVSFASKYKDVLTISFSVLSFVIACTSLFFSGRTAWHDRSRLKISGHVVYEPLYEKPYKIEIVVLNVGRRDAVLEGMQYHYENGTKRHSYQKEGIIIKEKQRKKFELVYPNLILIDDEGDVYHLEDITILDVEEREHRIPKSRELIAKLNSNKEF